MYLFILIIQARICLCVIYTDVGLRLECLPQIFRQLFLVYSAELLLGFDITVIQLTLHT